MAHSGVESLRPKSRNILSQLTAHAQSNIRLTPVPAQHMETRQLAEEPMRLGLVIAERTS